MDDSVFVIELLDTRWLSGPSFFSDGRVIPEMLNCSASLRSAALAYSGDPRTAAPLAGLNVRNLAALPLPLPLPLPLSLPLPLPLPLPLRLPLPLPLPLGRASCRPCPLSHSSALRA